jgi:hypothetical protein
MLQSSATETSDLSNIRRIRLLVGSDKLCIQAIIAVVELIKSLVNNALDEYPLIRMEE